MTHFGEVPCREMLAQLPDVLFRYRLVPDRAYAYVSDAIHRIAGYTPEEFYADPDFARRVVHPDDLETLRGSVINSRTADRVATVTIRWICRDARVIWTELRTIVVFDESGNAVAIDGVVRDVTERVATTDALRRSEATLKHLLDSSPVILYTQTTSNNGAGRLASISANVESHLGYSPEYLMGDEVWPQLVHPDDVDRVFEGLAALNARGVAETEYRFRHADGSWRWMHDRAKLTRDSSGNGAVVGCWVDVTSRRVAEDALRERDAHFRTMIEHGTDVVATLTPLGVITYESPSAERLFGYRPDEIIGTTAFARVHPDDIPRVQATWDGALFNGLPGRVEYRYHRKDGTWMHVESFGRPILDEHGAVVAAVVSTRDITERRRTRQALEEAHAFRKAVEESVRAGLIAQDRNGRITYVNRGFVEMFGWAADELMGTAPPFPYWPPENTEQIAEIFHRVVIAGELPSAPLQVRYMKRSGERIDVEILISPLSTAHGPMMLAAMYDVTARKLLESELRQAQKLEAIGRLAGGVAHDFNNILTAILGYAELALDQAAASDPLRPELEEIRRAGERAAALTRQLLAFSRQQVLQPEVLGLNGVIEELTRMLRRVIGEDVRLTTALAPDLRRVKADRSQIEQMLMNLVVNARDAMPSGGTLLIQTGNVTLAAGRKTVGGVVPPGSYVAVAVSDTGCGMSPQTASHLFEPFFTTKEKGKGTGLGLATVYGAAKQSGAVIAVDTYPGRGTSFTIYFPVAAGSLQSRATGEMRIPRATGRGETILFVDDEPGIVALGREVLARHGYRVKTAANAEDALNAIGPDVDLLVTDVVMRETDGPTLALRVGARHPGIPALFISGYTGDAISAVRPLPEGAHLLKKPFTPAELLASVRGALGAPREGA